MFALLQKCHTCFKWCNILFQCAQSATTTIHVAEEGVRDSLCVSAGRDGKLRIWSLEQFCLVYTLDLGCDIHTHAHAQDSL